MFGLQTYFIKGSILTLFKTVENSLCFFEILNNPRSAAQCQRGIAILPVDIETLPNHRDFQMNQVGNSLHKTFIQNCNVNKVKYF